MRSLGSSTSSITQLRVLTLIPFLVCIFQKRSHFGSDTAGVNTTRRYLCEALSFQYRYVPIGLLEVLPGRINDRAPAFRGRDELGMSSPLLVFISVLLRADIHVLVLIVSHLFFGVLFFFGRFISC
jgi:hypothetical protein